MLNVQLIETFRRAFKLQELKINKLIENNTDNKNFTLMVKPGNIF